MYAIRPCWLVIIRLLAMTYFCLGTFYNLYFVKNPFLSFFYKNIGSILARVDKSNCRDCDYRVNVKV